jgi:hypothetical protein
MQLLITARQCGARLNMTRFDEAVAAGKRAQYFDPLSVSSVRNRDTIFSLPADMTPGGSNKAKKRSTL